MILLADLSRFCFVGGANFLLMVAQGPEGIHIVLYSRLAFLPPSITATDTHDMGGTSLHTEWIFRYYGDQMKVENMLISSTA